MTSISFVISIIILLVTTLDSISDQNNSKYIRLLKAIDVRFFFKTQQTMDRSFQKFLQVGNDNVSMQDLRKFIDTWRLNERYSHDDNSRKPWPNYQNLFRFG